MFLLGAVLFCFAVLLFVAALLVSRNPKPSLLKKYSAVADLVSLTVVTCLFSGLISMFLAFQIQQPGAADFLWAAGVLLGTAAGCRFFNITRRLAAYDEEEKKNQGKVIEGDFIPTEPYNKPTTHFRKAA